MRGPVGDVFGDLDKIVMVNVGILQVGQYVGPALLYLRFGLSGKEVIREKPGLTRDVQPAPRILDGCAMAGFL